MLELKPAPASSVAANTKWILGMAFFRKYYSIFDLSPGNARIGLVGGRLERQIFVDKNLVQALPDFWGLLFLTIFIVLLLCTLFLCLCKVCCQAQIKMRYSSALPFVAKTPVIPPSPVKPVQMSPTKVVEHFTEEPTYYEEVVQEPVSGVYCGECKLTHPDMKHITIEQLKREDLESLQNL
jgi:hypothetical protein